MIAGRHSLASPNPHRVSALLGFVISASWSSRQMTVADERAFRTSEMRGNRKFELDVNFPC